MNPINSSSQRIPLYVLTGFLGSGKTTLLNHLLKQPEMARTLVVINEFGEISLDHLLVAHSDEDMVLEMDGGCLCCTIRGDLAKTLNDITWRFARDGKRQFDRVIIETTGLAEPAPILHTLITDQKIARQYRLQGVVTTVDQINAEATLSRHPESQKQVALADLLLLTKTDLPQTDKYSANNPLKQKLQRLNPTAMLVECHAGVLPAEILLQLDHIEPIHSETPLKQWINLQPFQSTNTTGRLAFREIAQPAQAEDINRHDEHIKAHCFIFDEPFSQTFFDIWLEVVMPLMGPDILRMKGIINLHGLPGPLVIHGVQHIFHPATLLPDWPDEDHRSKLVFITYDISREALQKTFTIFSDVSPAADK